MKLYPNNPDIIMLACGLLPHLAEKPVNHITIAAAGGIPVRIVTLVHHPTFSATLTLTQLLAYLQTSFPKKKIKKNPPNPTQLPP